VIDLSFRAIGVETMRQYWPVFAAGALVELWVVRARLRRVRPFPPIWVAAPAVAAALMAVGLWVESFLATRFVYQTIGEGARVNFWEELQLHYWRSRPLLAVLAVALLGLVRRPRSEAVVAALVVAAGISISWMAAMWLYTNTHSPIVFRVLVRRGGLGVVASLAGFTTATALWVAIGRWIWRQGRRPRPARRHRLTVEVVPIEEIRAAPAVEPATPVRALLEGQTREDDQS
jgi:hypothetical protein